MAEERPSVGPAATTSAAYDGFHHLQQGNKSLKSKAPVDDQYFTKAIDTHFLGGSYSDIPDSDEVPTHARRQSDTFVYSSLNQNSSKLSRMRQISKMEDPNDRTPLIGTSKAGRDLSRYGGVLAPRSTNQNGDFLIDIDHEGETPLFFSQNAISNDRKFPACIS